MPDLSKISTEELLKMREAQAAPALAEVPTEELLKMREAAIGAARPKVEGGESFLRGAAQGATFGFSDEVVGLGKGLVGKLQGEGNFNELYSKYRDEDRLRNKEAQLDNPKAFIGGNVLGGIGTSLIPGVGLAKGATAAANLGKAALLGGAVGAGTSEADLVGAAEGYDRAKTELGQFGKDVGKGVGLGIVTQGAFSVGGKAVNALKPQELRKLADVKTLKAAGYMGSELKRMSETEKGRVAKILHESGVVKAFDSLDDVARKAAAGKDEAGEAIGQALGAVDDLVSQAKNLVDNGKLGNNLPLQAKENLKAQIDKQFQFNMARIGRRIQNELIEPNADNPLLKTEIKKLVSVADDFGQYGPRTLAKGNVVKGTQGKVTNFDSDTLPQAFKREVYDIIKTELDDIVARTGTLEAAVGKAKGTFIGDLNAASRNAQAAEAYQKAKQAYGALRETAEIAQSRLGQTQANREISLTDYLAGGAALATGGPATAVVAGGANKLMRKYGDSVMAAGARKAAEIIEKTPQVLGKYAGLIEDALSKGGPALEATHAVLMKEPDYRAIIENFERSGAMRRRLGQ
jgi:hypothetical protein